MSIFNIYEKAYDILPGLLAAICQVESGHNPYAVNVNDGGSPSFGKCQVKLATARMFSKDMEATDLLIGTLNVSIAAKYLAYQYKRYGNWEKAVAAYNAGSIKSDGRIRNRGYTKKVYHALENRSRAHPRYRHSVLAYRQEATR